MTTRKRRRGDAFIKRAREHIDGGDGHKAREELMAMERRYPDISRGGETSLLIAESFYVEDSSPDLGNWRGFQLLPTGESDRGLGRQDEIDGGSVKT